MAGIIVFVLTALIVFWGIYPDTKDYLERR